MRSIVLVTYNPDIDRLRKNLENCTRQVDTIYLIDNSDSDKHIKSIKFLVSRFNNILVKNNYQNLGIGKAQNIGFQMAINDGQTYIMQLDQDTIIPDGMYQHLVELLEIIERDDSKVAGVGPNIYGINKYNMTYRRVDRTLSSGFLVKASVLKDIGMMDEQLFMDMTDWEWCWRARYEGYHTYISLNITIDHRRGLGDKYFLFLKIGTPASIRLYYMYRNSFLLFRINYVPLKWKIFRIATLIFKIIYYCNDHDKYKYIRKGIIDGIKGKSGQYM